MAEDTMSLIYSPHFNKQIYSDQIEKIKNAAANAQEKIDYESAHNSEIIRSIHIVETFLKKSHRLCYGGQAINAHLPVKYKFYDPAYNVPDYDFMTPDQSADIRALSAEFRKAGFTEISAKEGMHAGTMKIYVNYVPVADITEIDPKLYELLSGRETVYDGISYMDADTLRMLMYLELGRPKGEVKRWEKVYERLMLLNTFAPIDKCSKKDGQRMKSKEKNLLSEDEITHIMDFIVREKRIFAGADITGFYRASLKGKKPAKWLMKTRRPIFFYTSNLREDANHIIRELKKSPGRKTKMVQIEALGGDLIPKMVIFLRNKIPILIVMEESACHSYYDIPMKGLATMRAASLDTLITLYFSMSLLKYRFMSLKSMECLAKELVEISFRARSKPDRFPFEFVSLTCSGKQTSLPSLIRSKVRRIRTSKKKIEKLLVDDTESMKKGSKDE